MVQKSTPDDDRSAAVAETSPRRRGRPRTYDHDAVVGAAIGAFFRKGYEATTLADLEAATGVDRSTLYNSFDGKAGLYGKATGAYLANADAGLFAPLLEGTDDGYADVLTFLTTLRNGMTSSDAIPGCLIVNDMAAGSDPEAARRYRHTLEEGLRRSLSRSGDGDAALWSHRARLLMISVLGLNLVSKATGDRDEVARLIDAMIDQVRAWQEA